MPDSDAIDDLVSLLQRARAAHQAGDFAALDAAADKYEAAYGEYEGDLTEWVHYTRDFIDCWVDAANHNWQYHDPVTEADWVPLAEAIAQSVAEGRTFAVPEVNGVRFVRD